MNTNAHIVFHIHGFEHHSIQPLGLIGPGDLKTAVEQAVGRFCHEIGLVPVSVNFRGESDGWSSFRVRLGTGRDIDVNARETSAYAVKVEG